MASSYLILAVLVLVALPLIVLVHELGHASVALRFTRGRVRVDVGAANLAMTITRGRLTVAISLLGVGGLCRFARGELSRRQAIMMALAGPAANLALSVALVPAGAMASGEARAGLWAAAAASAVQAVENLIPCRRRLGIGSRVPSDGFVVWSLWRNRSLPAAAPARRPRAAPGREPVTGQQLLGLVIGVGVGAAIFVVHAFTLADTAPWLAGSLLLALQTQIGAPRLAPATRVTAPPARPPGTRASSAAQQFKRCPACGDEVLAAAKLCWCYHAFDAGRLASPSDRSAPPAPRAT